MTRKEYQLREITPEGMCVAGACPRIYDTGRDTYVLIGKQIEPKDAKLESKVGSDEQLIEIPKAPLPERRE